MEVLFDEYLIFPANEEIERRYNQLHKHCGSVEAIEIAFEIEFSCGDGKFLSKDSDFLDDEELGKYDGNVCLESPPRFFHSDKLFKTEKYYRFTVKYFESCEEEVYYLNNKEISRKWVG